MDRSWAAATLSLGTFEGIGSNPNLYVTPRGRNDDAAHQASAWQ
jgi:hypothetical protein